MATNITSRISWQRLVYNISIKGFLIVLILGCQVFYPIVKNYQDSEVPADQIATIDGAWNINGIWEVKADQEKVLVWELEESRFSDNRVRQFKLKPGNYEILCENFDCLNVCKF